MPLSDTACKNAHKNAKAATGSRATQCVKTTTHVHARRNPGHVASYDMADYDAREASGVWAGFLLNNFLCPGKENYFAFGRENPIKISVAVTTH